MAYEARRSQNEVWFRQLNERLEARALARDGAAPPFEIVCECDLEECTERIAIAVADYERVRAHPLRFILVTGHENASLERVIERHGGWEIVEKHGRAAAVADLEDPRS